jgi:hypothetical protein
MEEMAEPMRLLVKKELQLYKDRLRPVLTGKCHVYRHDGQNGVLDPEPWSANEFALPDGSAAYIVVQRMANGGEDTLLLRPKGVRGNKNYRIYWDRSGDTWEMTGTQLRMQGIPVEIKNLIGSELLTITETKEG